MTIKGDKNKLFKGLTEHDVLTWEEEKMRYQRKVGSKVTDLEFLRHLLMVASRPVISSKEGVKSGFITGQGPIYEKGDTLLAQYRNKRAADYSFGFDNISEAETLTQKKKENDLTS
ncbi:hypothetical protein EU537_05010 [Candidatus Thorarchaeota archaeon]|nr:MAG: hypothetical protein EU537_05010 [Candidatus Thorarchaeota archaeon]